MKNKILSFVLLALLFAGNCFAQKVVLIDRFKPANATIHYTYFNPYDVATNKNLDSVVVIKVMVGQSNVADSLCTFALAGPVGAPSGGTVVYGSYATLMVDTISTVNKTAGNMFVATTTPTPLTKLLLNSAPQIVIKSTSKYHNNNDGAAGTAYNTKVAVGYEYIYAVCYYTD